MFDGYKALSERLTGYFDVPGIEFQLYPLLEVKDALKLVGLGQSNNKFFFFFNFILKIHKSPLICKVK